MYEIMQAKVTMLGDANSGKSSIIQRFISNSFQENINPTIGATFLTKVMDFENQSIKLSIWDTAGQERYNSLASSYSRDSSAVVMVYDITNRDSFVNINRWHNSIKDHLMPETKTFVVGNKEDLVENEKTSLIEATDFAKSINATYMRTSAKMGSGVRELFVEVSKQILGVNQLMYRSTIRSSKGVSLLSTQSISKKKKGCCKN